MSYREIIKRADRERRRTDRVAWQGKCVRCGAIRYMFGDQIEKKYRDYRTDLREKNEKCSNYKCEGRVRWYGRVPIIKAIHLNDIRRRKTTLKSNK